LSLQESAQQEQPDEPAAQSRATPHSDALLRMAKKPAKEFAKERAEEWPEPLEPLAPR
jgi:hypothetical protein